MSRTQAKGWRVLGIIYSLHESTHSEGFLTEKSGDQYRLDRPPMEQLPYRLLTIPTKISLLMTAHLMSERGKHCEKRIDQTT